MSEEKTQKESLRNTITADGSVYDTQGNRIFASNSGIDMCCLYDERGRKKYERYEEAWYTNAAFFDYDEHDRISTEARISCEYGEWSGQKLSHKYRLLGDGQEEDNVHIEQLTDVEIAELQTQDDNNLKNVLEERDRILSEMVEKTQKENGSSGSFKYRVAQVMAGEYRVDDIVPVCRTPSLIRSVGFSDGDIVITQKHIRNCLAPEEKTEDKEHRHDLPIDFMDNLPNYIAEPAMILSSLSHPSDSIVLVTDCKDKKDRPIIIALKDDGKGTVGGKVISCNVVTSTYGKDGFTNFLNGSLKRGGMLYYNEKKSRDLVVSAGLRLPRLLANYDSDTIIRRYNENVNTLSQEILQDPESYSSDGYGKTLYRPDGKPFAYSDPDGRQKLYEYEKDNYGEESLSSMTVIFPDGRSEITRYDTYGYGDVVGIERKDAHGLTMYKYSKKWSGEREASYEYSEDVKKYGVMQIDEYNLPYTSAHVKEHEREDGSESYYDKYSETWEEKDIYGNRILLKKNVYGDDGVTPNKYDSYENRREYDRRGNVTSSVTKDHGKDITATVSTYYTSSEWYDYYNLTPEETDEETDGESETPIKSEISRKTDGRITVKEYAINGEYNGEYSRAEFASDGSVTEFRSADGKEYTGESAQKAYLENNPDAPIYNEIADKLNTLMQSVSPKTENAEQKEKTQKEKATDSSFVSSPQQAQPLKDDAPRPPFKAENIPQELKDKPQWAAYSRKGRKPNGHYDKKIYDCNRYDRNPETNSMYWASHSNPATWADFNKAVAYKNKIKRDGVSVALKNTGVMCIDLDNSFDADGKLTPHAAKMIELAGGTYAEKSSSGEGLHIFVHGNRPEGYRIKNDLFDLEVFDDTDNRFISMTGDMLEGASRKILPASSELMSLLRAELIPRQESTVKPLDVSMSPSDSELMKRIESSKRGMEFSALNRGELLYTKSDGTPDHSKCDYAYCNMVLFFNGGDVDQAVRLIKSSGLHRQNKPDKYYELTARNALSGLSKVYTPKSNVGRKDSKPSKPNERG